MSISTAIAQFAVYQSTSDVDAQVAFYKTIGWEVDHGWEPLEEIPETYFSNRGVSKNSLVKSVALKLPADTFFHLILTSWTDLKRTQGWPAPYNQIGSRGHAFLVESVEKELARVEKEFPELKVLERSMAVSRRWGMTTTALIVDPEDVFFELIEIGPPYGSKHLERDVPTYTDRSFLHFMLNCSNFKQTSKFYRSFGYTHDHGVDFRPDVGFHPHSYDYFTEQMKNGVGLDMNKSVDVDFLWNERDPSHAHVELCDYQKGYLKDPGPVPTWPQKGIARYCIKTPGVSDALEKAKKDGHRIYIDDQRGCLNWGDSQWFYFADVDGNIVTLEEWFPHRAWGEKK